MGCMSEGEGHGVDAHLAERCLDQHQRPRVYPQLLPVRSVRLLSGLNSHLSKGVCSSISLKGGWFEHRRAP